MPQKPRHIQRPLWIPLHLFNRPPLLVTHQGARVSRRSNQENIPSRPDISDPKPYYKEVASRPSSIRTLPPSKSAVSVATVSAMQPVVSPSLPTKPTVPFGQYNLQSRIAVSRAEWVPRSKQPPMVSPAPQLAGPQSAFRENPLITFQSCSGCLARTNSYFFF